MTNFFGITYFSVLIKNRGKFLLANENHDEYIQKLFDEERLALRFEMFSKMTVPSLALMKKDGINYKHFVVYSKDLPVKYREYLLKLANMYSFIHLIEVIYLDDLNIRTHILEIFKNTSQKQTIFGYFGLDDDDILSINYLEKMKGYLKKDFLGMNVVFSKGYTSFYEKNTDCLLLREVRFPFINIGQMRICEYDGNNGIYIPNIGSHMLTDVSVPTVIDSTSYNFIWLRHLAQDTSSNFNVIEYINKIKNDLNRYPVANKITVNDFPLLDSYIRKQKAIVNHSDIELKTKNEDIILVQRVSDTRTIKINYILESPSLLSKQALVKFFFSRELTKSEIAKSGLVLSRNGYYRYLSTVKDINEEEFLIEIPKNVGITSICVCKWGSENTVLKTITVTGY